MAIIGLQGFRYAKLNADGTYAENKTFAKAVSSSFSGDPATGTLYADDRKIEEFTEFSGGSLTLSINDNRPVLKPI
jgi:hypothetical protein